jgi:hypothetical protein
MEVGEEFWNFVSLSKGISLWDEADNVVIRPVESDRRKGKD